MSDSSLVETWKEFKKENPKVRIRDAAVALGTSEMSLVATACDDNNTLLRSDFKGILDELESLGPVMALTRSDHVVHESHGVYKNMKCHGSVALFLRPGIDARFFLDKWSSAYAVNENNRHSLQFFDAQGDAIHKIYVTNKTNVEEYSKLVRKFSSAPQELQFKQEDVKKNIEEKIEEKIEKNTETESTETEPDNTNISELTNDNQENEINPETLKESWLAIRNVHESGKIIKQYGNHRRNEIYQKLGKDYAVELDVNSIKTVLETASEQSLEIMIFAINHAAVQVFSGRIKKLLRTGPWYNILDPGFNLHLRTEGIGKVWLVLKPSDDGWVTSIDVLDKDGIEFLLIADNRVLGQSESLAWQDLCNSLLIDTTNKESVA